MHGWSYLYSRVDAQEASKAKALELIFRAILNQERGHLLTARCDVLTQDKLYAFSSGTREYTLRLLYRGGPLRLPCKVIRSVRFVLR